MRQVQGEWISRASGEMRRMVFEDSQAEVSSAEVSSIVKTAEADRNHRWGDWDGIGCWSELCHGSGAQAQ